MEFQKMLKSETTHGYNLHQHVARKYLSIVPWLLFIMHRLYMYKYFERFLLKIVEQKKNKNEQVWDLDLEQW
jgi:hypothetical protein